MPASDPAKILHLLRRTLDVQTGGDGSGVTATGDQRLPVTSGLNLSTWLWSLGGYGQQPRRSSSRRSHSHQAMPPRRLCGLRQSPPHQRQLQQHWRQLNCSAARHRSWFRSTRRDRVPPHHVQKPSRLRRQQWCRRRRLICSAIAVEAAGRRRALDQIAMPRRSAIHQHRDREN